MATEIRLAGIDDASTLAALRWMWSAESKPDMVGRDMFEAGFRSWMSVVISSHIPFVACDGNEVIGVAWLVRVPRVPEPGDLHREHGDLQSVYVVPFRRNEGVGGQLVRAAIEHARALGLGLVTVQAGRRSRPLYLRSGFAAFDRLLQITLASDDGLART